MQSPLDRKVIFDVSYTTFFRAVLIIVLLSFLYVVRDVLFLIFIALVIAAGLDPLIDWLQKKRIPRAISAVVLFLLLLGVIAGILYLLIPPLYSEIKQLVTVLPNYIQNLFDLVQKYTGYSQEQSVGKVLEFANSFESKVGSAATGIYSGIVTIFGGILAMVVVFVLTFYFIVEENSLKKLINSMVPFRHKPYVEGLVGRMQFQVGRWLRGQLVLGLIIGVLIFIGLSILGVKYALVLALVAALFEVVPYIGTLTSAVLAVLLTLAQSPFLALMVIIVFFIVQELEHNIIVPNVMKKVVGLNPLVIVLVILLSVKLIGPLGAFIGVPLATAISVFLRDIFADREKAEKTEEKSGLGGTPELATAKAESDEDIQKRLNKIPPEKKEFKE